MGWGCPYTQTASVEGKWTFQKGSFPECYLAMLSVQHNMRCISELILPGQYEANSNEVWRCFSSKAMRPYLDKTIGATYGTGKQVIFHPWNTYSANFFLLQASISVAALRHSDDIR